MKRSTFITAENLPNLAQAFGDAVDSAGLHKHDDELKVAVIGEPGVGKSYISTKLAEGVLGSDMHSQSQSVPRDDMHDLILWSYHTDGEQEILQYDEASKRFVDDEYHNFVMEQRKEHPIPERTSPGVTFIEHPDQDTEDDADIVVRIRFSELQKSEIARIRTEMEHGTADLTAKKQELANVAAQGCEIEIETQSFRFDDSALIEFFDNEETDAQSTTAVPAAFMIDEDEDFGEEAELDYS